MSRDGLFFKVAGKLGARGVPVNSLWVQWGWTCLLCLSGSYGQLLGLCDLCGAGILLA